MKLTFEWDEAKAKANFKKHKVNFEEGKTIFNDLFLFTFRDNEHSNNEERFLVVTHTERNDKIRIINCRKATKSERRFYEEGSF